MLLKNCVQNRNVMISSGKGTLPVTTDLKMYFNTAIINT